MRTKTIGAAGLILLCGIGAAMSACVKTEQAPPLDPSSCAGISSKKIACLVEPGEFPPPDCDPSAKACSGAGACSITDPKCGPTSACLALADNTKKPQLDFRIRRLNFSAPDSLAEISFQERVVTKSIDLANKECGENGYDSWSWLLRIDRAAGTLTTGGAPPTADPFGKGFCFYNKEGNGFPVQPSGPLAISFRGNTFSSAAAPKLYMPTFVKGDLNNMIVLPWTNLSFRLVTVSDDSNCIGAFNPSALNATCAEDPATCSKWTTDGAIAGHVTLEEADEVAIPAYHQSLCALLTKTGNNDAGTGAPFIKCPRDADGKLTVKGDYCGETLSPCGCQDSFWVAATFSASAANIHDGTGVPECKP